jgi:hypothetical protein
VISSETQFQKVNGWMLLFGSEGKTNEGSKLGAKNTILSLDRS